MVLGILGKLHWCMFEIRLFYFFLMGIILIMIDHWIWGYPFLRRTHFSPFRLVI